MRNDDHGGIVLIQSVFQPADGVDVQVIGRLVQQQHIWFGEQSLRQQHAQFKAWCHFAHVRLVQSFFYAHARQQCACARFCGIAIVFSKFAFQFGRAHVVVFGGFHIGINGIAFGHGGPHLSVAHHHHIQYTHVFIRKLILAQFTQTHTIINRHLTTALLQIPTQYLHKSGFT